MHAFKAIKLFKNVLYQISCVSDSVIGYLIIKKFSPSVHEIVLFEPNVIYNIMHTETNFEYGFAWKLNSYEFRN